jgi:hypothetical protein
MRRLLAAILVSVAVGTIDIDAAWERITTVPRAARALVVNEAGGMLGFAANRSGQRVFSLARMVSVRSTVLNAPPDFYAYARDAEGAQLCLPLPSVAGEELVCFDHSLRRIESTPLLVPMTSGALTAGRRTWVVDPSGTAASKRTSLVLLQPTARGWTEVERHQSPLCQQHDSDLQCGELEIHPLDNSTLALIPLLGTFDGEKIRFPPMGIWKTEAGTVKQITVPDLLVPLLLRHQYAVLRGAPLRVVYRSAASQNGRIAIIPVLPAADENRIKRDQLWLFDGIATWHRMQAPGQLNAVAFVGDDPIVVTTEGVVLRWKR